MIRGRIDRRMGGQAEYSTTLLLHCNSNLLSSKYTFPTLCP
jgi:hypothetical protein